MDLLAAAPGFVQGAAPCRIPTLIKHVKTNRVLKAK